MRQPTSVAVMGQEGSYHDVAAANYFGQAYTDPQYCRSFDEVFAAVASGTARYGITAVENSIVGALPAPHDLLRSHSTISAVGEIILRINHCLAGIEGAAVADLREVRSHPAALAQCKAYLSANLPHAVRCNASDTASALLEIAQANDPTLAAIADREAATKYGLKVLAHNIADDTNNQTRFLVLARRDAEDSPILRLLADKTSLLLENARPTADAHDKVHLALSCFTMAAVTVRRMYEHPIQSEPGRYAVFIDVDGSADGSSMLSAIGALEAIGVTWREIGTYQRGKVV